MDILNLAEQYYAVTFIIVLGIGFLQGSILGRGIRSKFPSLKKHAKAVSIILLMLFSINSIAGVLKFAEPAKVTVSELSIPATVEEVFFLVISLSGINAGVGAVIATFVTITLILFLRLADIHQIARYFIFVLSCTVLAVSLLGRFTDFIPNTFQIVSYAFYQFGITLGIFIITRRKEFDMFSEIK